MPAALRVDGESTCHFGRRFLQYRAFTQEYKWPHKRGVYATV